MKVSNAFRHSSVYGFRISLRRTKYVMVCLTLERGLLKVGEKTWENYLNIKKCLRRYSNITIMSEHSFNSLKKIIIFR